MNPRTNDQIFQFIESANSGDLKTLKYLLTHGVPADALYCLNGSPCTALSLAVQNGNIKIAKELLKWGADCNFELVNLPLLWIAAFRKDTKMVSLLIKHGAFLNKIQCTNGSTPLFVAIYNSDYNTAKLLIDAHCDVDIPHLYSGNSPLHQASLKGQYKLVQELIKAGAKVDSLNNEDETPLLSAIEGKNILIITFLLSVGANLNHISCLGRTALSKAHQFFPAIDNIIRQEGKIKYDISQSRGIDQIILYYKKMSERFPEVYKEMDDEISSGLCAGLSSYYSILTEEEKINFLEHMKRVDAWGGDIETITKELKEFFEKTVSIIIWLHASVHLSSDLKPLYIRLKYDTSQLINFIQDKNSDAYEKILSIGFLFKVDEVKRLLKALVDNNIKACDHVRIFISANFHVITIRKIAPNEYIYDSNSAIGEFSVKSIDELANNITKIFGYNKYKPNIGLHVEVISNSKDIFQKSDFDVIKKYILPVIINDRKINNEMDLKDSNTSLNSLAYAVLAQDFAMVTELINLGAIINDKDAFSGSLAIAAQTGNIKIAEYLINSGADVNAEYIHKDKKPSNPLFIAISYGFENMVQLLLKHGANPNYQLRGLTPIMHAVMNDDLKLVNELIKHGANIEGNSTDFQVSPLFIAVQKGSNELIEFLLQHEANFEKPCYKQGLLYTSPLSLAIHLNRLDVLKMFVKNGADLNKPICNNVYPVDLATDCKIKSYIEEQMKRCVTHTQHHFFKSSKVNLHNSESYPNQLISKLKND